jgi:hypothetical protein
VVRKRKRINEVYEKAKVDNEVEGITTYRRRLKGHIDRIDEDRLQRCHM